MVKNTAQTIKASELLAFIEDMTDILTRLLVPQMTPERQDAVSVLSQSLLHDIVFLLEMLLECLDMVSPRGRSEKLVYSQ